MHNIQFFENLCIPPLPTLPNAFCQNNLLAKSDDKFFISLILIFFNKSRILILKDGRGYCWATPLATSCSETPSFLFFLIKNNITANTTKELVVMAFQTIQPTLLVFYLNRLLYRHLS